MWSRTSKRGLCRGDIEAGANQSVLTRQQTAASSEFSNFNQILSSRNHSCKTSLRLLVTCASSCQKYHCELNFIEFFLGAVKRYLRENCDYTFKTLKTNLPKAMASVRLSTIRLWEHRMHRWMSAYRSGLEMKTAQLQVKEFSSRKYKSHRRVLETVACLFD